MSKDTMIQDPGGDLSDAVHFLTDSADGKTFLKAENWDQLEDMFDQEFGDEDEK